MADFEIRLTMPQHLYDRARRLAEERDMPLEEALLSHLEQTLVELPSLPPDEQAELDALERLSDDALWTIAREQMAEPRQQRMQVLMGRNNLGTISPDERAELEALVEQGERLMLRKAKALALLTGRGYSIQPQDLSRE